MTATGGGQSVRTAAAVQREVESYDVTLKDIDRDGKPAAHYSARPDRRLRARPGQVVPPYDQAGTVKVRVPKGDYILNAGIVVDPEDAAKGVDWLAQPKLSVTKNTTVTLDARTAKPVDITVPDTAAKQALAAPEYA